MVHEGMVISLIKFHSDPRDMIEKGDGKLK